MTALKDFVSNSFCIFQSPIESSEHIRTIPSPVTQSDLCRWRWLMQAMSSYLALLLLGSAVASQP